MPQPLVSTGCPRPTASCCKLTGLGQTVSLPYGCIRGWVHHIWVHPWVGGWWWSWLAPWMVAPMDGGPHGWWPHGCITQPAGVCPGPGPWPALFPGLPILTRQSRRGQRGLRSTPARSTASAQGESCLQVREEVAAMLDEPSDATPVGGRPLQSAELCSRACSGEHGRRRIYNALLLHQSVQLGTGARGEELRQLTAKRATPAAAGRLPARRAPRPKHLQPSFCCVSKQRNTRGVVKGPAVWPRVAAALLRHDGHDCMHGAWSTRRMSGSRRRRKQPRGRESHAVWVMQRRCADGCATLPTLALGPLPSGCFRRGPNLHHASLHTVTAAAPVLRPAVLT